MIAKHQLSYLHAENDFEKYQKLLYVYYELRFLIEVVKNHLSPIENLITIYTIYTHLRNKR